MLNAFSMRPVGLSVAVLLAGSTAIVSGASSETTNAKSPLVAKELFSDSVIARGKGFEIKRSQLDEEVIRIKAQLAAANQPVPPERNAVLQQGVLEQMIGLELMNSKATDADRAEGKALAEKRMDEAKARLGSDEMVNLRLKAENLTREQLLAKWTQAATAETVVKREIKVNITDADAKKYYDENPGKFEQPEMVRASHVLLNTRDKNQKELPEAEKAAKRKQIEDLLKRARAGEDFAKLVEEFSEDPGKKSSPEYTFAKGRMVPEFEAAAFSLAPGQISDVVTTQYGYHIIKVSEKLPPKKVEFEKVVKDLKDGLTAQAIQKEIPTYMKKLKQDYQVEILDPKLQPSESPAGTADLGATAPSTTAK